MTTLTVGELFAGYGGLGLGLNLLTETRTSWVSDIAPGPRKILAHRLPDAPNLGDITTVDWTQVEPVDVITGGSPCQDMSVAGKRAGMIDGTRSGLWSYQADAVAALRPKAVVWENVRGALTARALTPDGRPTTAILRVTSDLTGLGYSVRHVIVRASDVGAPHQRARVFLLATLPGYKLPAVGGRAVSLKDQVSLLLPTPAVNDMGASYTPETWDAWTARMREKHRNGNGHGRSLNIEAQRITGGPHASSPEARSDQVLPGLREAVAQEEVQRTVRGHGSVPPSSSMLTVMRELSDESAGRLVQVESSADHGADRLHGMRIDGAPARSPQGQGRDEQRPVEPGSALCVLPPATSLAGGQGRADGVDFGPYTDAIERWEKVLGRTAPSPTEVGPRGVRRLSAEFCEFMMGLPAGWITNTPDVTRTEALKLAGNGVVPQQAAHALSGLASRVDLLDLLDLLEGGTA